MELNTVENQIQKHTVVTISIGTDRPEQTLLNTTCPVLANSVDPDQLASKEAN